MKLRTKGERHLHRKFESIASDSGLTGQEKRAGRRVFKRQMSKASRGIDHEVIKTELDKFDGEC
jgi:hypothetical protein